MKTNTTPNAISRLLSLLLVVMALLGLGQTADAQHFNITSNWFVTNGVANLKNDGNNRTLAYNAVSNQVLVAYRGSPSSIAVLDAPTGNVLGNVTGSSTIATYCVGVADDGVIYGVPLANGVNANNLNIYAFTNWLSGIRQCYAQTGSDATS
jgi:hypothetical protein